MKKTKTTKNQNQSPQHISQKKQQRKKIIKIACLVVVLVIASISVYLGFGIFKQVSGFSKAKLMSSESSIQVDANGTEYYGYGREGYRKNVSYDDIPQVMIDAVIAAEDSRFFEHNGFDLPRIIKALMGNIAAGGITGGGSTITQQVIKKSYYPKEEQTLERKIGEVILSIEATSQTTKEEILELYLNKIYFGYGNKAIGIYAASKYYFDKEVQDLTLPEAALLAGALNSPTSFDPFNHLDKAQNRRDLILKLMWDHGYITEAEYEATKAIPVENTLKSNPISTGGQYQAYADKVTREVYEKTGMDPNDTPMIITTYIDLDLQKKLDAIASGEDYSYMDEYIQVGASVQESTTGRIIGIISGRDYEPMGTTYAYAGDKERVANYEIAAYGQRNQPGSSLKPIIAYAAAFEFLNYSTAHLVHDIPYQSGDWVPGNWNNSVNGDVTIQNALRNSWNLAAIDTYNEVISGKDFDGNNVGEGIGNDGMIKYLEGFGFDMYGEELGPQYAIGGWSNGVSPEEEAAAYAVIANGGTYIEPHTVAKIELLETGEIINLDEQYQNEKQRAISEESTYMIRDIMTSYVKSGGGSTYSPLNLGYQIGAKSGTSNHSDDVSKIPNSKLAGKNKDAWLTAYSPDYSWSVWTGYSGKDQKEGRYLRSNRDSNAIAVLIAKYIHQDGLKNSYPSQPEGITQATCVSGIYPYVKPGDGIPENRIATGWFKKNNLPSDSVSGSFTINTLSEFTASVSADKINVSFTEYNPKSMTESATPTRQYTAGGKTYTLPYYGSLTQLYGKVVYVVEVANSSGTIVHSEKLSTNTATLNYSPSAGTYTVTGYYALESGNSSSNKISQNVTVEAQVPQAGATYSQTSLTSTQLVLQVNVPTGHTVRIDLNGATQDLTESSQVTFNQLTPNTSYSVQLTEILTDGSSHPLTPFTFTTPAE